MSPANARLKLPFVIIKHPVVGRFIVVSPSLRTGRYQVPTARPFGDRFNPVGFMSLGYFDYTLIHTGQTRFYYYGPWDFSLGTAPQVQRLDYHTFGITGGFTGGFYYNFSIRGTENSVST